MMRFPMIHQHDATDCGPAALAMIAARYGKRISLARLRELAGTDRHGTTLSGLISASQAIGMSAKAVRAMPDSLDKLDLPLIAHWREGSRHHYLVVYKLSPRHVYIADPAYGRRKLTREQFHKNWSGVLLLVSD